MYKFTVASMFRDSVEWAGIKINQVERFRDQILSDPLFNQTQFLLLEGDSSDATYHQLNKLTHEYPNIELIKKDIKSNFVGSLDNKDRIQNLASLGDTLLDLVDSEYLIWVESDLIHSNLVTQLYCSMLTSGAAMVAPLVFLEKHAAFYDTWGFRNIDGERWKLRAPFDNYFDIYKRFIPMSSVGSCAIINGAYIRNGCRFGDGAFPNLCEEITRIGGKIVVDKDVVVSHPGNRWINNRWI